jgi:hypothetical protein
MFRDPASRASKDGPASLVMKFLDKSIDSRFLALSMIKQAPSVRKSFSIIVRCFRLLFSGSPSPPIPSPPPLPRSLSFRTRVLSDVFLIRNAVIQLAPFSYKLFFRILPFQIPRSKFCNRGWLLIDSTMVSSPYALTILLARFSV